MLTTTSELRNRVEAVLQNRIPRALTPPQRPLPQLISTGITAVDAITGGIPLGCLSEICGPSSSGRTSVLLAAMAEFMRRGEICALIDATDAFDPQSAANAGVDLGRLLWVRSAPSAVADGSHGARPQPGGYHPLRFSKGEKKDRNKNNLYPPATTGTDHDSITRASQLEQALKATDLLLQAGGFGLIVLDIADIPISAARRIPLTTWFRFRRTVENTSMALIVVEQHPHAKSCASLVMDFATQESRWTETADQDGTPVDIHGIPETTHSQLASPTDRVETGHAPSLPNVNEGVAFRVTSEGIVIPFDTQTASFQTSQRWNTHARLLNTVHVRLQVTRSRINRATKFPASSESAVNTVRDSGWGLAHESIPTRYCGPY
jgi:recombination protein RecA